MRLYFDYASTTPVDPEVRRAMSPYFSLTFGNPGSLHSSGQDAMAAVDLSREKVARALHADFREIIFTGSATEANNLALRGAIRAFENHDSRNRFTPKIIISAIEHESILETARDIEKKGVEVIVLPVSSEGVADLTKFKDVLDRRTILVSVMSVNNEIGTIEPIRETSRLIRDFRGSNLYPLFHSDAAQAFPFLVSYVDELGVDLLTISGHKMYGPKGVAALFIHRAVKEKKLLHPLMTGGGQEFGLRSGTENVPLIVGFAKAVELAERRRTALVARLARLRDAFLEGLRLIYPRVEVNGTVLRTPHILNLYFPGYSSEKLLTKFDLKGLSLSSGSACAARSRASSPVIRALGYSEERARSSVRVSFGAPTTLREVDRALRIIKMSL